ncbi:MAG: glycosyltransferase family protein [Deferribacterota bacterium]|nr:glycosyltransferase family protein [Deferribacterota bacterium]
MSKTNKKDNNQNHLRIMYGIGGHGNGHITRSIYVAEYLQKNDCEIKILTFGQGSNYIRKYYPDYDFIDISGFDLYYKKGALRPYKTFYEFIRHIPIYLFKNFFIFLKVLLEFQPDIILSDFEPFTQILAKTLNIPLIGIDNVVATIRPEKRPVKFISRELWFTNSTIRFFTRNAKHHFILSFAPELIKIKKWETNITIVQPIIRENVINKRKQVGDDDFILVYQTSNSTIEQINDLTKTFSTIKFIVYGLDVQNRKNVIKKQLSYTEFIDDLSRCTGIVCNGGFSLISEAIYLKKPIFAMPIKGQYEQRVNGSFIAKKGYGVLNERFDVNKFGYFINNIDEFRENLKNYYQIDNNDFLLELKSVIQKVGKKRISPDYGRFYSRILNIWYVKLIVHISKKISIYKNKTT